MYAEQPMAAFLQAPFVNCRELLLQSYNLKFYPLQMMHLSGALLHAIVTLAATLTELEGKITAEDAKSMTAKIRTRTGFHGARPWKVWQLGEILDPNPVHLDTLQLLEVAHLLVYKLERSVSPLFWQLSD
jgi:hypothetical protein